MNIVLYSNVDGLQELCHEVAKNHEGAYRFRVSAAGPAGDDEIIVLDLPDSADVLLASSDLRNNVVVVDRARLQQVEERLLTSGATILLTPVTLANLEMALEQAASGHRLSDGHGAAGRREEFIQQLLRTNLRLQELEQNRATFVARCVHEFRAPLTALDGYCRLLLSRQLGPLTTDQEVALGRIHSSVTRLSGVVSVMLRLSLGQTDSALLVPSAGYLGCVERALAEMSPLFDARHIEVQHDLRPYAGTIAFDQEQMERVFINLLDNCRKFTPRGGSVRISGYSVSGAHASESYRVDIADSGPGIPLERIQGIFDEHISVGTASDRSGAGLGLSICKAIVRAHRGRIWASSDTVGATFSVELPLSAD